MAINIERRKKVMARSMKLGHCICNPAKEVFANLPPEEPR
jgi:hypothetical protein